MEESKISKKDNKIVIVILMIGVLLIGIGFGFLMSKSFGNKDNKKTNNTEIDNNTSDNKDNDSIIYDSKYKEELMSKYDFVDNNFKTVDINGETVSKLFDIFHKISNSSKEEIALYQIEEKDITRVSCDFYLEKAVEPIAYGGEATWCGDFTDEIANAYQEGNVLLVKELMSKNTTEAIKEELLREKMKELFGISDLSESISLRRERVEVIGNKWWGTIPGNFVFFEKVEGKDYYARVSGAGGDSGDYNKYSLKAAYEDNDLYLVYEIETDSNEKIIHVMKFVKEDNGNYLFVEDK